MSERDALREAIAEAAEDAYDAACESDQAYASVGAFVADAVVALVEERIASEREATKWACEAAQGARATALRDAQATILGTATHSPLGSAYGTLEWRRMALAALAKLNEEEQ